jgi:predicted DNA-binding protein
MSRMSTNNAKIIVDDQETKVKLKALSDHTGKSMKAIIQRLVELEYNITFYDLSSLYPIYFNGGNRNDNRI